MKVLSGLVLTLFSLSSFAVCKNKIDPAKVVLFIDTNNSEHEIDTAEKAACSRGERLIIAPKNYKAYTPLSNKLDKALSISKACQKNKKPCEAEAKKAKQAFDEFEAFKAAQPSINDATKSVLEEVKQGKAKLQSVIISGHDGGGTFSGTKGNFTRQDLGALLNEVEDINEVKSLLLLGCYTGVQKEVLDWKKVFPNVRMIGGYNASAPLSDRPQGHAYLSALLLKEKQLISQADEKKLNAFTRKNLSSMFGLHSALYLRCEEDNNEKDFYFSAKNRDQGFIKLNQEECLKEGLFTDLENELLKYESGELEPPKDTVKGALRSLYNKTRELEHCLELTETPMNINSVFNLLFYEGVKNSFAHHYKNDLENAEKIISKLDAQEFYQAGQEILAKEINELELETKLTALQSSDPVEFLATREKMYAEKLNDVEKIKKSFMFKPLEKYLAPDGRFITPAGKYFSKAEQNIIDKYKLLKTNEMADKAKLIAERQNVSSTLFGRIESTRAREAQVKNMQLLLHEMKNNPDELKSIWVPNAANLSKKSRKELMSNLNKINKMMSIPGISDQQYKTLANLNKITSDHLVSFQNPFSWHEYNGLSVEPPSVSVEVPMADLGFGLGIESLTTPGIGY